MADNPSDGPRLTWMGKLFILVIIAACLFGAYFLFMQRNAPRPSATSTDAAGTDAGRSNSSASPLASNPPLEPGPAPAPGTTVAVEIGIAYGTEKKRWFENAVDEFAKTPQGASIKVNLIPLGSLEGAQALLRGDEDAKHINVWSPASSLYTEQFVQNWTDKFGKTPIAHEEEIALTPMVFVFWDERYQAFISKYKTVDFDTINQALSEKGGWDAIAGKPEWGLFKFGHTHPNKSNSGLMTLVLMAYDYHHKNKDLALKDVLDAGFQTRMDSIERGATGMIESTGTMMRDMVLKGPSSYDALFVYESVVIDYLKNAEGRWGKLHIVYPAYNAWNDNPYYVIDAPWSSKDQRRAAEAFLKFLLSEPIQRESLTHGFRPGNPSVPVNFPESPFILYQPFGLRNDLTTVCDPPKSEVMQNLLLGW